MGVGQALARDTSGLDHAECRVTATTVVPVSLSAIDRKQLALLHRILARLVKDQADDERLGHDGDAALSRR